MAYHASCLVCRGTCVCNAMRDEGAPKGKRGRVPWLRRDSTSSYGLTYKVLGSQSLVCTAISLPTPKFKHAIQPFITWWLVDTYVVNRKIGFCGCQLPLIRRCPIQYEDQAPAQLITALFSSPLMPPTNGWEMPSRASQHKREAVQAPRGWQRCQTIHSKKQKQGKS